MSEYTTIYLRCKEIPLLKYKVHPSYEECQKLSKEDLMKVNREIDEYNKQVTKSLGCKLFYLSTTPSRELTMLPWSPSPSILTKGLLDEILYFYREEIDNYKNARQLYTTMHYPCRITLVTLLSLFMADLTIDKVSFSLKYSQISI